MEKLKKLVMPVVTLNEFEPAAGIKVSKIINLMILPEIQVPNLHVLQQYQGVIL